MVATWRRSQVAAFFGGKMSTLSRPKAWSRVVLGLCFVLAVACDVSSDATTDVALTPTVETGTLASSAPTLTSLPTEVPSPTATYADPYAAQREELVKRTIVDRGVTPHRPRRRF